MKLPAFLRRWAAMYLVWNKEELGGILYDYANGEWTQICQWETASELKAAKCVVQNMIERESDQIYITTIKTDQGSGLFVVEDSNYGYFFCPWYAGMYEIKESLVRVAAHCRKIATSMGYRKPEDNDEETDQEIET